VIGFNPLIENVAHVWIEGKQLMLVRFDGRGGKFIELLHALRAHGRLELLVFRLEAMVDFGKRLSAGGSARH
jgi:hypothetical protein